jgi:hypothetical protein
LVLGVEDDGGGRQNEMVVVAFIILTDNALALSLMDCLAILSKQQTSETSRLWKILGLVFCVGGELMWV